MRRALQCFGYRTGDHGNICICFFSANVHHCKIAFSVVDAQFCFKLFKSYCYILYLHIPAWVAPNSIKRILICASGGFVIQK